MMPLRFGIAWNGAPYTVLVSIYARDGTVAIAHGGVEVGQGINTKVPLSCDYHMTLLEVHRWLK